ncbi:MAG: HAMP domain-containing sensor histidine kinase [Lapillicoccus sp.]
MSRRWPWTNAGVRVQATLAAAVVVAVAMLLGGVAIVAILQNSLTSTLQDSITAVVAQDATTLRGQGLSALASSEADRGADSVLVQVIDGTGSVAYTSESTRRTPQSALRPAPGVTVVDGRTRIPFPVDLTEPLVVARGVEIKGADWVVLAASSQESQGEAVSTTGFILLVGIPLLVALAAAVTWWRVGRALGTVEQISERVERIGASAQLTERVPVPASRDEIAHLATTMNLMLQRLESSQSAQHHFVADASHELRSPLATLSASLEVASADDSGRTWRELAPVLRDETGRMTRLVNDLLLLSRTGDRSRRSVGQDVDLDDLAERECRRARHVARVPVDLTAAAVRVTGDAHELSQVLRNVIDNASRAAESRVQVAVAAEADTAIVVVADDGPGIPVGERERVFDRFVRLDESRSRTSGGSGLGLAIARQLVGAHGGTISVGTSEGLGGAEVTIRLPLPESR